mgnify:CR=1 FL=1
MRDFWEEEEPKKKINKKKIVIIVLIVLILISSIVFAVVYFKNEQAREWIDKNVFRKEVLQNEATTIDLNDEESSNIYAFNKYIGILNKNKFSIYGSSGNEEQSLDIQISSPIFCSADRFLVIGEKKGQKLYLITDKDISWEASVEGNISQVYVNKNGYVAVAIVDTLSKTVISVYDTSGKELFKTYLSSTRTADVAISNDNKHLAIAEIDTSGTVIQSNVKIISIDKASSDPTNSLENTFKCASGKLLTDLQYQDKNRLVCMYTDSISIIEDGQESTLIDNANKNVIFQSIELNNNITSLEEQSSGLFTANTVITIMDVTNKTQKQYTVNSVVKSLYTAGNVIAVNVGTEVEFVNTDGWLVKRYIANQEITNIVMTNDIAGIIYRDKIELVNL